MVRIFVWPWKDDGELLAVRDLLYPDPNTDAATRRESQQLGVNIVNTWKLRRCRIPHSIEATADLIDAILHHDIQSNSVSTIKAVYASALAKMVTSVCDLEQDSVEKRTMIEQARKLGMPEDWVHIRHSITHGRTPGLETLRSAVGEAVPWMWKHFWMGLEGEEAPKSEVVERLREVLVAFRRQRRLDMTTQSSRGDTMLAYQTSKAVHKICKKNSRAVDLLVRLLLGDKLVLPSPKQTSAKFKALLLIWEDLLLNIASKESTFHHAFATCLADRCSQYVEATPETIAVRNATTDWLRHILLDPAWLDLASPAALEDLRSDVLEVSLLSPNRWTESVVGSVVEEMDGDMGNTLSRLAQATFSANGDDSEEMEGVEDRSAGNVEASSERSGWERPVDIWIPKPIGV